MRGRETERQRDRETERHERQRDTQTDKQTDRQTGKQTDIQTDRQTGRQTDRQTHTNKQKTRQTHRQPGKQTNTTTDTQTHRHTPHMPSQPQRLNHGLDRLVPALQDLRKSPFHHRLPTPDLQEATLARGWFQDPYGYPTTGPHTQGQSKAKGTQRMAKMPA